MLIRFRGGGMGRGFLEAVIAKVRFAIVFVVEMCFLWFIIPKHRHHQVFSHSLGPYH
jgi:hypothetical protein